MGACGCIACHLKTPTGQGRVVSSQTLPAHFFSEYPMTAPAKDRRAPEGALLAIMNHVDFKLDKHTEEEMKRYREIFELIETHRDESRRERQVLLDSVKSYFDKTSEIHEQLAEAFLVDRRGKPDYSGHARAHEAWMQEAKEARELRLHIKRVVTGALAVAVLGWLWAVVYPAFLAGPK